MVMMERFGSPANRMMTIMKNVQIPVRSVQPGDKLLVITDDAMDPNQRLNQLMARRKGN